ncbi:MAG: TlpA family protein disulfide reductase [Sphingomonas sp.]
MTLARGIMVWAGLVTLALTPAVAQAQVQSVTTGRSVTTLKQVPLTSRSGKRITLGSRIKPGKPTVIAIWASWCLPCYAEAPYLNQLRRDLGGRYNFLYVNRSLGNPDPEQPAADIAQFLVRTEMTDVDYLFADVGAYREILGADVGTIPGGRVGIPRIYLFNRQGRQIYSSLGFTEEKSMLLDRLLRQEVAPK